MSVINPTTACKYFNKWFIFVATIDVIFIDVP